ncbi:MAG: NUDIX domain-containing protein [Candidatus Saccharibacteria bacterium]|nr:NUDIX domain-containing protein [Candidatus Saccharibacteria bacterium]
MSYEGSYVFNVRQKLGHETLITATVDIVATRGNEVCLVFNKDFNAWTIPGGHVELGDSWQSAAKTEAMEEAGIIVETFDLEPFATVSGAGCQYSYANGDEVCPFTVVFACDKFTEEDFTDVEEISEKRWVGLDELEGINIVGRTMIVLEAYKKYRESKIFQQVVL